MAGDRWWQPALEGALNVGLYRGIIRSSRLSAGDFLNRVAFCLFVTRLPVRAGGTQRATSFYTEAQGLLERGGRIQNFSPRHGSSPLLWLCQGPLASPTLLRETPSSEFTSNHHDGDSLFLRYLQWTEESRDRLQISPGAREV